MVNKNRMEWMDRPVTTLTFTHGNTPINKIIRKANYYYYIRLLKKNSLDIIRKKNNIVHKS